MDISDRFTIDAPLDAVWEQLRDPHAIATCFPGVELLDQEDDTTYSGRLRVRFGPTTVTFRGKASITADDATHTGSIDARGRDGRGSTTAAAQASVTVTGDATATELALTGTIDVTGPLSSFASTGGVHVARALFEDFAANVAERAAFSVAAPNGAAHPVGTARAGPAVAPARPASFSRILWRSFRSFLRGLRPGRTR